MVTNEVANKAKLKTVKCSIFLFLHKTKYNSHQMASQKWICTHMHPGIVILYSAAGMSPANFLKMGANGKLATLIVKPCFILPFPTVQVQV